jgi:outer membrane receptor protein involved in Fe transport
MNQLAGINLNASGELMRLFGDRPIGLALGYEFRTMKGESTPDPITVAGLTTGNKGLITAGSYYVNEGYGELSIPLLSNMPFVQNLEATAAARVFKYSTFGSDWTYKFGARYTPVRDVTVRGTYSTAFRAPSISDLFLGQADNFPSVKDPCRGPPGRGPAAPAPCGAAANNGDTSSQLRSQNGGEPKLRPETAKTWTIGLVLEPTAIKNFSVTFDYYNISVEDSITNIGASIILNACYGSNLPQYCALVKRDPTSQRITNIIDLNTNVGKDQTDGLDLAVRYALPTEYGRFGFIFDGTWLHKFQRTLADGSVLSGRGTYDLGTGSIGGIYPAFKFNAGVAWSLAGFGAGVNSKFIGAFHECGDSGGDFSGGATCTSSAGTPQFQRNVPAYVTFDLFASYSLQGPAGKTTLAAGVNNVGDHKPAVIYNGFLAASDPTAYDFMGRFMYARLSHTF